jgi:hypothetical protein
VRFKLKPNFLVGANFGANVGTKERADAMERRRRARRLHEVGEEGILLTDCFVLRGS